MIGRLACSAGDQRPNVQHGDKAGHLENLVGVGRDVEEDELAATHTQAPSRPSPSAVGTRTLPRSRQVTWEPGSSRARVRARRASPYRAAQAQNDNFFRVSHHDNSLSHPTPSTTIVPAR
jgi:hypothetical protein